MVNLFYQHFTLLKLSLLWKIQLFIFFGSFSCLVLNLLKTLVNYRLIKKTFVSHPQKINSSVARNRGLKKIFFYFFTISQLGKRSLDQNSVDRNCVLSVDRNFTNQLTKFLDAFQLIETFNNDFGQTPKI